MVNLSFKSFGEWEAAMSSAYVPTAVEPLPQQTAFRGELVARAYGDIDFTSLRASGQRMSRTQRMIARSNDEALYATICVAGGGRVGQDDRLAELRPGDMVFLDSRRPSWSESYGEYEQIVVQIPVSALAERGGWTNSLTPTAVTIEPGSAAGIVADYLRKIVALPSSHPEQAAELAIHTVPMVVSAMALTAGELPVGPGAQVLAREQVLAFMSSRCGDPALTVDDIARGCLLSRRALYRLFDGDCTGVMGRLWSMRVTRAEALFRADPTRSCAAIAAQAGFSTERQFYRVFRAQTGRTPGQFRDELAISGHPLRCG
ncbi:AraC-like ligand-binding domain-containing protein [Nocardia sp. IBHARD005]|uniref:AraC-like ligand-binding domain-containing protein n=1 Tax=Nocardia sp. IBHARD005 TaxID=3457765 RepID=UPI004059D96F